MGISLSALAFGTAVGRVSWVKGVEEPQAPRLGLGGSGVVDGPARPMDCLQHGRAIEVVDNRHDRHRVHAGFACRHRRRQPQMCYWTLVPCMSPRG